MEIWGSQHPTVEVTVPPALLTRSGLTSADIARAFAEQNRVVDAGALETGESRLRIESTGTFRSLDDIRQMTITSPSGEHFRLGDIARVEESYARPASNLMRIDGRPALGVAVATVSTGNVVEMARAVAERIDSFAATLPGGYALHPIYDQGHESEVANRGFVWNLVISVLTVVAILLFFIGLRNGLLIGSGLIFSIFATLMVMQVEGIALQRMSLAAIIIAMGMLVDNAIVVSDSALVAMQRGMRKRVAILRACSSTALPLLAATVIAILTFLPIYYSPHITGELLSSLVVVIGVSLMFSWVFALTQTPFFIQEFVPRPRPGQTVADPYGGRLYDAFRSSLRAVIRRKYAVVGGLLLLLALSAWSFRFIPKVFTPSLDKPYFTVDLWMPEGTRIERTDVEASDIAGWIGRFPEVEQVSAFVGRTAALLPFERLVRPAAQLRAAAGQVQLLGRGPGAAGVPAGLGAPPLSRTAGQGQSLRTQHTARGADRGAFPGARPGGARLAGGRGRGRHAPQSEGGRRPQRVGQHGDDDPPGL